MKRMNFRHLGEMMKQALFMVFSGVILLSGATSFADSQIKPAPTPEPPSYRELDFYFPEKRVPEKGKDKITLHFEPGAKTENITLVRIAKEWTGTDWRVHNKTRHELPRKLIEERLESSIAYLHRAYSSAYPLSQPGAAPNPNFNADRKSQSAWTPSNLREEVIQTYESLKIIRSLLSGTGAASTISSFTVMEALSDLARYNGQIDSEFQYKKSVNCADCSR